MLSKNPAGEKSTLHVQGGLGMMRRAVWDPLLHHARMQQQRQKPGTMDTRALLIMATTSQTPNSAPGDPQRVPKDGCTDVAEVSQQEVGPEGAQGRDDSRGAHQGSAVGYHAVLREVPDVLCGYVHGWLHGG